MRELFDVIWHRFNVIAGVVADANARAIAVIFYFTIFVPFAILSLLFTDPLRKRPVRETGANTGLGWVARDPIPNDIESARQQG